jgi:hypothetical protein
MGTLLCGNFAALCEKRNYFFKVSRLKKGDPPGTELRPAWGGFATHLGRICDPPGAELALFFAATLRLCVKKETTFLR